MKDLLVFICIFLITTCFAVSVEDVSLSSSSVILSNGYFPMNIYVHLRDSTYTHIHDASFLTLFEYTIQGDNIGFYTFTESYNEDLNAVIIECSTISAWTTGYVTLNVTFSSELVCSESIRLFNQENQFPLALDSVFEPDETINVVSVRGQFALISFTTVFKCVSLVRFDTGEAEVITQLCSQDYLLAVTEDDELLYGEVYDDYNALYGSGLALGDGWLAVAVSSISSWLGSEEVVMPGHIEYWSWTEDGAVAYLGSTQMMYQSTPQFSEDASYSYSSLLSIPARPVIAVDSISGRLAVLMVYTVADSNNYQRELGELWVIDPMTGVRVAKASLSTYQYWETNNLKMSLDILGRNVVFARSYTGTDQTSIEAFRVPDVVTTDTELTSVSINIGTSIPFALATNNLLIELGVDYLLVTNQDDSLNSGVFKSALLTYSNSAWSVSTHTAPLHMATHGIHAPFYRSPLSLGSSVVAITHDTTPFGCLDTESTSDYSTSTCRSNGAFHVKATSEGVYSWTSSNSFWRYSDNCLNRVTLMRVLPVDGFRIVTGNVIVEDLPTRLEIEVEGTDEDLSVITDFNVWLTDTNDGDITTLSLDYNRLTGYFDAYEEDELEDDVYFSYALGSQSPKCSVFKTASPIQYLTLNEFLTNGTFSPIRAQPQVRAFSPELTLSYAVFQPEMNCGSTMYLVSTNTGESVSNGQFSVFDSICRAMITLPSSVGSFSLTVGPSHYTVSTAVTLPSDPVLKTSGVPSLPVAAESFQLGCSLSNSDMPLKCEYLTITHDQESVLALSSEFELDGGECVSTITTSSIPGVVNFNFSYFGQAVDDILTFSIIPDEPQDVEPAFPSRVVDGEPFTVRVNLADRWYNTITLCDLLSLRVEHRDGQYKTHDNMFSYVEAIGHCEANITITGPQPLSATLVWDDTTYLADWDITQVHYVSSDGNNVFPVSVSVGGMVLGTEQYLGEFTVNGASPLEGSSGSLLLVTELLTGSGEGISELCEELSWSISCGEGYSDVIYLEGFLVLSSDTWEEYAVESISNSVSASCPLAEHPDPDLSMDLLKSMSSQPPATRPRCMYALPYDVLSTCSSIVGAGIPPFSPQLEESCTTYPGFWASLEVTLGGYGGADSVDVPVALISYGSDYSGYSTISSTLQVEMSVTMAIMIGGFLLILVLALVCVCFCGQKGSY